jgi:hypothetical protein
LKNHITKIRIISLIIFTLSTVRVKAEVPPSSCFPYFSLTYSSLKIETESVVNNSEKPEIKQATRNLSFCRNVNLHYRIPEIKDFQTLKTQSVLLSVEKTNVPLPKLTDIEICSRARSDAENFHGKKTGYFIGGMLLGPLAILNAAVIKHRPSQGERTRVMSENKDLFEDPTYQACYNRRAKWILVKQASYGTIVSAAFIAAFLSAFN